MTHDRAEDDTDTGTRAFVERVDGAYSPPDRTPAQNNAFDHALRERIDTSRSGFGVVLWGTAMAAAAIVTLVIVGRGPTPDETVPELADAGSTVEESAPLAKRSDLAPIHTAEVAIPPVPVDGAASSAAEAALMALTFESDDVEDGSPELEDALPDDYAAINSLLLGG